MNSISLVLGILSITSLLSLGQATEETSLMTENRATVTRIVREAEDDDRYEDLRIRTAQFIDNWQCALSETGKTELLKSFYKEDISNRDLYRLSPALVYAYSYIIPVLGLDFLEAHLKGFKVRNPLPLMLSGLTSSLLPYVDHEEIFVEERTESYAVNSSFVAVLACHTDLAHDLLTQRGINPLDKILKGECRDFFNFIAEAVPTLRISEIEDSELKNFLFPLSEIQQHNPTATDPELALPRGLLAVSSSDE